MRCSKRPPDNLDCIIIRNLIASGQCALLQHSPNFFNNLSTPSHQSPPNSLQDRGHSVSVHKATMHSRPPFFTEDSIRSRDISDPQAYRLSYSVQPHQMTPASKRASKMASMLKRESVPAPAPAQTKGASYKPGLWLYMAFATLGVLTIMVALDATALSVALPVRRCPELRT